jgi:hypothetical protein
MNIRIMASILQVEQELEQVESALKRKQEWRSARKISSARASLAQALRDEQEILTSLYIRYQQTTA